MSTRFTKRSQQRANATPEVGGIHVTFDTFTLTLLGHAGPGVVLTLDAAGNPVVPAGSVALGASTSLVASEGHVFAPALTNGDFDILGTFRPCVANMAFTTETGTPP